MDERKLKYGLLEDALGWGEVAAQMGTGLFGTVLGLPGSTVDTLLGRGSEEQQEKYPGLGSSSGWLPTVSDMVKKFTYEPRTEAGKEYSQVVGKGGQWLDDKARAVSGAVPGILDFVPGEWPGAANFADQSIYTALNVANPLKMAGTSAVLGSKAAQLGAKAVRPSADLVTPVAKLVGKNRYNMLEKSMGQLISRKQLAGLQPGVLQDTSSIVSGWYTGPKATMKLRGVTPKEGLLGVAQQLRHLPMGLHLKEMGLTAGWRNPISKLTNHQDSWLRRNFGITENVYRELERLAVVQKVALKQKEEWVATGKSPKDSYYRDADGNLVLSETDFTPITTEQMMSKAGEQIHAQIAYNVSVLEKYSPGDPRISRLMSEELQQYLMPKNADTTIFKLSNDPSVLQNLIGENIPTAAIKDHIAANVRMDNNLKGDKVNISTKPFFVDSVYNQAQKSAQQKIDGAGGGKGYLPEIETVLVEMVMDGQSLTKANIIENMLKIPGMKKAELEKYLIVDNNYISMRQSVRTDDTLLATMPIRGVYEVNALKNLDVNAPIKKDGSMGRLSPKHGFYSLMDQMKQGTGLKVAENILDIGSDTNKLYIDVRPLTASTEPTRVMASQVPKVDKDLPNTRKTIGQTLSDQLLPELRKIPSSDRRRFLDYANRPTRGLLHQGSLTQERGGFFED